MERKQLADQLLQEWHHWTDGYRPKLGIPGHSIASQQAVSSNQWLTTSEIADQSLRRREMETIDFCVNAIPLPYQQAIGREMRNRESNAKVWRMAGAASYADALDAILPIMQKRYLLT